MASTYSPSLRLELIATGEQSGLWGDTTNNNLGALLEQAITGVETISMLDLDYTLSALNGSVDESRNAVINMTSAVTLTATRNVFIPADEKIYIISNTTLGGQSLTVKVSGGGTGYEVPNGKTCYMYCDGTNVKAGVDYLGTLTAANITATNLTATNLTLGSGTTGTGSYVRQTAPTITNPTFDGTSATFSSSPTFNGGVSGVEGGEVYFAKPASGTNFSSVITNDVFTNAVRWFATYSGGSKIFALDFSQGDGTILTTGNYNSYAPTLTGTGASGTWGISISGTAGALNSGTAYSVARILGGNGSAASPTYSFSSDGAQDTGFYWVSDGVIGISSNGIYRGQIDSGGNLTMTGNITAYSDESLKTDWANAGADFVEKLSQIKAGTYNRTDLNNKRQAGVSAQGVQQILPEVIETLADGKLSLAYGNLAVVACVELAKRVVALEAEVKSLKGE